MTDTPTADAERRERERLARLMYESVILVRCGKPVPVLAWEHRTEAEKNISRAQADVALNETATLRASLAAVEAERDKAQAIISAARAAPDAVEAALKNLRSYAASVWFDESVSNEEERNVMEDARAALQTTAPPSTETSAA